MNKLFALAASAAMVLAAAAASPAYAAEISCSQAPTCESLGYSDTTKRCPGEYTVCPFDSAKVRCILEAQPGDIKYSLKTKNHDGWLLCNGSSYNKNTYKELFAVIGTNFGGSGSYFYVPNYVGSFLKSAAASSMTSLKSKQEAGLPNITGTIRFRSESGVATGAFSVSHGNKTTAGHKNSKNIPTFTLDASKSSPIYGRSTTVTPQNYSVNTFIYSGKLY